MSSDVTTQARQYSYMEEDKSAVVAANEAFYHAFAQRDLKAMNLVWWQGEGSTCIHPGGRILKGWQAIQISWEGIFRHTEYLEIETEVVTQTAGTQVACIVVSETVLQSTRGRRSKAQSLATNVFEKMAQKWYLVHHHGSPIIRS